MSLRRALIGVAVSLALVGCKPDPLTEIMVVVRSDMTVPEDFDGFRVEVKDPQGEIAYLKEFPLGTEEYVLPADFGVVPQDDDASRRITVEIFALKNSGDLFSTRAKTKFVTGEVVYLDMFLAERCIGVTCLPSETCRREGCVDENIVPITTKPQGATNLPLSFGSTGEERLYALWATNNRVAMAAIYGSPFELGGIALEQPGTQNAGLVSTFDFSGMSVASESFVSGNFAYSTALGETPDGRLQGIGYFDQGVTWGEQTLQASVSQQSYFFQLESKNGGAVLERLARGAGNVQSFAIAVADDGRIAVGGIHRGGALFGSQGSFPPGGLDTHGEDDAYVAVLDPERRGLWAQSYGGIGPGNERTLTLAWAGNRLYAGGFLTGSTSADFNDGQTWPLIEAQDGFVVIADGQSGTTQSAIRFGGTGDDEVARVGALPNGLVGVVGTTASPLFSAGNQTGQPGTDPDGFAAAIDPSGNVVWILRLLGTGASEATDVRAVEFQGENMMAVAGSFSGTLTLPNQTLTAKGQRDGFVALFQLDGTHLVTLRAAGGGNSVRTRIATREQSLFVAGSFQGQISFHNATLTSVGANDLYLHQLLP